MNWAEQQPGETRSQWKERMFAMHYGAGPNKLREMFERNGRMPQPGDTFSFTVPDGFSDTFSFSVPPEADPMYSGRSDGRYYDRSFFARGWFTSENSSQTESLLNLIEDWDTLGVELPDLILVPTPDADGVYTITRME